MQLLSDKWIISTFGDEWRVLRCGWAESEIFGENELARSPTVIWLDGRKEPAFGSSTQQQSSDRGVILDFALPKRVDSGHPDTVVTAGSIASVASATPTRPE
jgi:hypothetical protein